jgi:hypothetical protein
MGIKCQKSTLNSFASSPNFSFVCGLKTALNSGSKLWKHSGPPMNYSKIWVDHYTTFVLFKHVFGLSHAFNWDILNLFRTFFGCFVCVITYFYALFGHNLCMNWDFNQNEKRLAVHLRNTDQGNIYHVCQRLWPSYTKISNWYFCCCSFGSACWKVNNLH